MKKAGVAVGIEVEKMLNLHQGKKVVVLVGKGYNGGNTLWAGLMLQQKGYDVSAYLLFNASECPSISQEIMEMFTKEGGTLSLFKPAIKPEADVIVDGILGAGFKGGATGVVAEAITWANQSKLPIVSVDIPSGLNGNTGHVGTVAIHASHTVAFFFPRMGFFTGAGLDHIGTLSVVNLGINADILSKLVPEAYLITESDEIGSTLQKPPIFFADIPLYYISDTYQIYEYFDFLDNQTHFY